MTQHRGTVVVTGANSGIGLATAIRLAHAGYPVIGTTRSPAKANVLTSAADAAGTQVTSHILDVTDANACEELIGGLSEMSALVNNAGYNATGAIEDLPDDAARAALECMAIAPMRLARLSLPLLRASRGRIVQISSIAGRTPLALTGWYSGAKFALRAASEALRTEVARDGIHLTLIEPGNVRTPIYEHGVFDEEAFAASAYAQAYRRIRLFNRLADRTFIKQPDDVAAVVESVLSRSRPPHHVLVGADVRAFVTLQAVLPARAYERVVRLTFGL